MPISYDKWDAIDDDDDDDEAEQAGRDNALLEAASRGDADALTGALRLGARPSVCDGQGVPAMVHAASRGSAKCVKALLAGRASADAADRHGCTALHHAAIHADGEDAVEALLLAGAPADARDRDDSTPLMQAALRGEAASVERLLDARAEPGATCALGGTALMRAASRGHEYCAELLIKRMRAAGGSRAIDAADKADGETALHAAAGAGRAKLVQLLLAAGATPHLRNHEGCTALELAREAGHGECVWKLQAAGADADAAKNAARREAGRKRVEALLDDESAAAALAAATEQALPVADGGEPAVADGEQAAEAEDGATDGADDAEPSRAPRAPRKAAGPGSVAPLDVSGDSGVIKKVMRPGVPADVWPPYGVMLRVRYKVVLVPPPEEARKPAADQAPPVVLMASPPPYAEVRNGVDVNGGGGDDGDGGDGDGGDGGLPLGARMTFAEMAKGEMASVLCRGRYAFGGDAEPNRAVRCLLELLDWHWAGGAAERLDDAAALKAEAAAAVGGGQWEEAAGCYARAVRLLTDDGFSAPAGKAEEAGSLLTACMLNQAMVALKLEQWEEAESYASASLARKPSAKGHFRRGTARSRLGDARAALADFRAAAALEPRSAEIRAALAEAKEAAAAAGKREKAFGSRLLDASAGAVPAAVSLPAVSDGAPPAGDGEELRSNYENERTIADAKLDGNQGNLVLDAEAGRLRLLSADAMGATLEGYSWGQTEGEVRLAVTGLPQGTRASDVGLRTTSTSLRLEVHGNVVLDGRTFAPILSDESLFQIDADGEGGSTLSVTLAKARPTKANEHWRTVVLGQPEIDVSTFGNPVVSFDENSASDVSAYMEYMDSVGRGELPAV